MTGWAIISEPRLNKFINLTTKVKHVQMELHNWLLFFLLAFIATVTPGPAILLASSHALAYGWRNAIFTALGNISGLLIMSSLSIAGLSLIILNSALIFNVIKFIGALYLIFLGIKMWRKGFATLPSTIAERLPNKNRFKLYCHGMAVCLSNPKAIAFSTALFPQFISHEHLLLLQFSVIVITFIFLSFSCLVGYAYFADRARHRVSRGTSGYLSKFLGVCFICAGLLLTGTQRNS